MERQAKKMAGPVARRLVGPSEEPLVRFQALSEGGSDLPVLAVPGVEMVDLHTWLRANRQLVRAHQRRCGGVLFRGFGLAGVESFEGAVRDLTDEDLAVYRDATTPRSQVRGNVYTSTDYPPDQTIFFHSELAYSQRWPMDLFFFCVRPADEGGETPIADTRRILQRIDPDIRDRFRRLRVQYLRNYGHGLGLDWRDVFKTEDRDEVANFCAASGIAVEWRGQDHLRVRAVRDAITTHPETGEEVWFNHVVLFHATSLAPEVHRALEEQFGADGLPHSTWFGDGSPIEPEVVEHLRQATCSEAMTFSWQTGDLLVLDNMLTAHSRNPYRGERRLLTAMTRMFGDEAAAASPPEETP